MFSLRNSGGGQPELILVAEDNLWESGEAEVGS